MDALGVTMHDAGILVLCAGALWTVILAVVALWVRSDDIMTERREYF